MPGHWPECRILPSRAPVECVSRGRVLPPRGGVLDDDARRLGGRDAKLVLALAAVCPASPCRLLLRDLADEGGCHAAEQADEGAGYHVARVVHAAEHAAGAERRGQCQQCRADRRAP